jgi:hypothetical protein
MTKPTYAAQIFRAVNRLGHNGTENPDTASNSGQYLAAVYLWSEVRRHADGQYKAALAALEQSGIMPDRTALKPGAHQLCDSHKFALTATVSEPVRRLDLQALAQSLNKSKYRVPLGFTTETIEACRLPTKSTVTLRVVEKAE